MIEEDIVTASRSSRRARLCAALVTGAVALVAGLALASCSAGQITQTSSQVAAGPGANANLGPVALRDLLIAYNAPDGYPQGGSAPLIVRIFNNGEKPVTLVTATAEGAAEKVLLVGGPVMPTPGAAPTGGHGVCLAVTAGVAITVRRLTVRHRDTTGDADGAGPTRRAGNVLGRGGAGRV
jgi:hypothetical protein